MLQKNALKAALQREQPTPVSRTVMRTDCGAACGANAATLASSSARGSVGCGCNVSSPASASAIKIRTPVASKSDEFTSQLFFDDALSQPVFAQTSYASKGAMPDTLNSRDSIYNCGRWSFVLRRNCQKSADGVRR